MFYLSFIRMFMHKEVTSNDTIVSPYSGIIDVVEKSDRVPGVVISIFNPLMPGGNKKVTHT